MKKWVHVYFKRRKTRKKKFLIDSEKINYKNKIKN